MLPWQRQVSPFLQQIFMPLVLAIFEVLSRPAEENDQTAALEKQMLRRSYFCFIQTIASSGMNEVMANQGESAPAPPRTPDLKLRAAFLQIYSWCRSVVGRSREHRASGVHHHPGRGGFPRPCGSENLFHHPLQTGGAVG